MINIKAAINARKKSRDPVCRQPFTVVVTQRAYILVIVDYYSFHSGFNIDHRPQVLHIQFDRLFMLFHLTILRIFLCGFSIDSYNAHNTGLFEALISSIKKCFSG